MSPPVNLSLKFTFDFQTENVLELFDADFRRAIYLIFEMTG